MSEIPLYPCRHLPFEADPARPASGLQGYLAHKKQPPLEPYSRNMLRVLGGS